MVPISSIYCTLTAQKYTWRVQTSYLSINKHVFNDELLCQPIPGAWKSLSDTSCIPGTFLRDDHEQIAPDRNEFRSSSKWSYTVYSGPHTIGIASGDIIDQSSWRKVGKPASQSNPNVSIIHDFTNDIFVRPFQGYNDRKMPQLPRNGHNISYRRCRYEWNTPGFN